MHGASTSWSHEPESNRKPSADRPDALHLGYGVYADFTFYTTSGSSCHLKTSSIYVLSYFSQNPQLSFDQVFANFFREGS